MDLINGSIEEALQVMDALHYELRRFQTEVDVIIGEA